MEHILKAYQRRLTNLSANNRSLLLRRLVSGLHFDFHDLDFVLGKPVFGLLQEVISGKNNIQLAPLADSRQAAVAPLTRKLQTIFRRAELLREEHGTSELYVGWPFVRGKFNDASTVSCPLLFFPVNLVRTSKSWTLNGAGTPFINKNFLLAYAHFNQVPADEELLNADLSDFPKDALEFRTALHELLKSSGLEINFNRELFEDKILPFSAFTKPDFEKTFKPGELKLFPEAVLGIFPQAGSFLMSDYDALLERTDLQTVEDVFPSEPDFNQQSKAPEQNTFAVFDLDASQEKILQEVKKGHSVVVQGPPGTGKSQLICNLVTDFAARGKTVWVVCQKRAALEVVQQRLASKGFGNFTALVHDAEADKRKIFNQLQFQIEEVESYKKQNNQFSLVVAERQFLEISRRLNSILQTLTEFKLALFNAEICGWSPKELYLKSNLQKEKLDLGNSYKLFTVETLPFFLPKLTRFLETSEQFENPDFILADRKSFANWNWKEQTELQKIAQEIPAKLQLFRVELPEEVQQKNTSLQAWELLNAERVDIEKLAALLKEGNVKLVWFQALLSRSSSGVKEVSRLHKQLERFYQQEQVYLSSGELESAFLTLKAFEKSETSFWQKAKWQLNSQAKKSFESLLNRYQLSFSESGVSTLKTKLEKLKIALQHIESLKAYLDNPFVYFSANPDENIWQFQSLKNTIIATQLAKRLIRKKWLKTEAETVLPQVKKLLALLSDLEKQSETWRQYFTETQIQKLAEDEIFVSDFSAALPEYFEQISTHDSDYKQFSEQEKTVVDLLKNLPSSATEKAENFENNVYLHWLYFLEEKFPVLKLAGAEIDKLETELQELLQQKQTLTHQIVATRLRERTYSGLEKNRLGNTVSYRKLYAQVSKKRNLFSLRKLHNLFAEEIADLIPCWLASPETISAVFPVSQTVDLLIFDEASQAFSESGLPAIARAKQVVIAGDEHQLGPTDLYRSRWQEEDEETEELIVESLLQLGSLHLPQHWLTQHYRSRFPELIEFSNNHFYRHKLQLIPHRHNLENPVPAISFNQISGIWKNQTNQAEAEKVTGLLFQLLSSGHQDIGIITFNYAQQNLVQDLVEKTAAEKAILVPETVLIKNIENMQGDEKQVIILSVGYAPDEAGKMNVQFGSLSQAKGENRLNVAVTRAISKLYVFCSFAPENLKVENAKNVGPKLLKEFLVYARKVSIGNFDWQTLEPENKPQVFYLKDQFLESENSLLKITQNLPFTDLVLENNNQFCQLIRTDDDLYFSNISARQTHADVPFLLQKRNWPYTNIYSRQFWLNPEKLRLQLRSLC
jgi:superfamily I DNA and/or RNA helicase